MPRDDRWAIKGRDDSVFERFREVKAQYDDQREGRVTDEKALELLVEGVPIQQDPDTAEILERLEELSAGAEDGGAVDVSSGSVDDIGNEVEKRVERLLKDYRPGGGR